MARRSLAGSCFLLLSGFFLFSRNSSETLQLSGYVEGEFVYITPTTSGILEEISVTKGQRVNPGQRLFALDTTSLQAALDQALARYSNLTKGKRPEEIAVLTKQKEQAEANLVNARKAHRRYTQLLETSVVSQAAVDQKAAMHHFFRARVRELSAALEVAKLGGRKDEVEALHQEVIRARNNLENAMPKARQNGRIEEVHYHIGEFVRAGIPVVSFLPDANIKIRFFIPEKELPRIRIGQRVKVTWDGSHEVIDAKVRFLSSKAEFTPPMIYSTRSREKLVFMAEALPEAYNEHMHPGLPVTLLLER